MRYVKTYSVKGKVYRYFRAGGAQQRLPGEPSSPEFQRRYRELLAAVAVTRTPAAIGSIEALIGDYKRSPEYADLSPRTRESYARELDRLAVIGKGRVTDLRRGHVLKMRDALAATPRTADLFVQVARRLLSWAVDRGYIDTNPLLRVSTINESVSHVAWSEADCAAFEASAPAPALLTAYMLGRYTGQRRGDVLRLARTRYDGSGLEVVQGKTGAALWIPAHERLRAHLDAVPREQLLFVVTARGGAWRETSFSHAFGDHLRAVGIVGRTFHGLRHTAAVALAEAGCSETEIRAITGHKTAAMVSRYTAQANQRRQATAAIRKMELRRPV